MSEEHQGQNEEPGQQNITVIVTPTGAVTRVENEAGIWGDSEGGMGAGRVISRAKMFQEKNPGYTLKIVNQSNTP